MEVKEPTAAYGQTYIQGLRKKLSAAIAETESEEKLERCMELLLEDSMPCAYTDEELVAVVRASESHGVASEERVKTFFARWGH